MSRGNMESDGPPICSRCGSPLAADAVAAGTTLCPRCAASAGEQSFGTELDPLVGQHLDDFEIVGRIGGSPTSDLYKARQKSADRFVALKLLPEHLLEDDGAVARFQTEAEMAAAVSHPNVVRVFSSGCIYHRHFIAVEHVPGESLASVLEREGRLPADRALSLMKEVASALAQAHAAGVIHCDIQPSNILIAASGHAKVTGFGLARRRGESLGPRTPTPLLEARLYFPPEAARAKPLDERSDLYLLGGTFYHAIGGRPPFEGSSVEERALQYARKDVPPLNQIEPTAPVALCLVIQKLLRRRPDERYQSAAEVLERLERIEAVFTRTQAAARRREPVWAQPARADGVEAERPEEEPRERLTLAERAEANRKRQMQAAIMCGAALFVTLIGVIVVLVTTRTERETTAVAVRVPRDYVPLPKVRKELPAPATAKAKRPAVRKPEPPPPPEPISLRAIDATIHGDARYEEQADKRCVGYWFGDDARVSWEVRVSVPGEFWVDVVLAAERPAAGNEYIVAIGEHELRGKVPETRRWTKFETVTVGRVTIANPGTHTLSVRPGKKKKRRAPLMNLRTVTLRRVRK